MNVDKSIQAPDGVSLLMENLWLRHKAGIEQRINNVFFVELPPLTEEETAKLRVNSDKNQNYSQEELYGVWI